jgi:hypothetical protein
MGVASADGSEVTITKDGKATVSSARVMQLAGPTLYTRLYWGDAFVRLLVKGNSFTKVYRSTGEVSSLSEIGEGDLLNMEGTLEPGGTALVLIPTTIKNISDQKKQIVSSGVVTALNLDVSTLIIQTKKYGAITANVGTTTQLIKGSRVVALSKVKTGDIVKQVSGSLDMGSKKLEAAGISIYVDPHLFEPQLHLMQLTGIVMSASSTVTSMTATKDNISYTLIPKSNITFLNKNRASVSPSRFVVGDTIRVWGALEETDVPTIDVEVVRNMNL